MAAKFIKNESVVNINEREKLCNSQTGDEEKAGKSKEESLKIIKIASLAQNIAEEGRIINEELIKQWDTSPRAKLFAYFLSYCVEDGKDNAINQKDDVASSDKNKSIYYSALDISQIDGGNEVSEKVKKHSECFKFLWQQWKGLDCESPQLRPILANLTDLYNSLKEDDVSKFEIYLNGLKETVDENIIKDLLLENLTLLQYACKYGKLAFAKRFIEFGFDVTYAPINYQKPIQLACENNHPEILQLLINSGALTNESKKIVSTRQCTLFHQAVWNLVPAKPSSHIAPEKCLEILINFAKKNPGIKSIGNVNSPDEYGRAPLHYAVMRKNKPCILLLLRNGACIDQKDNFKQMPLSSMQESTLLEYFDSMISMNRNHKNEVQKKDSESYDLEFNFSEMFQKTDEQEYFFKMDLLRKMKREKRLKNLIGHPIISIIIYFQWYRIRVFFYSYILFYFLFTAFYTPYVILEGIPQHSTNETTKLIHEKSDTEGTTTLILFILSCTTLTGFSLLELVKLSGGKPYITSLDNIIRFITFALAWTFLLIDRINDNEFIRLKAMSILMVWFEFFLVLSKYPPLTYHIITFRTASVKLIKFLFFHSVILIGFAISFHILFRKSKEQKAEIFQNVFNATFKTIIMLTSEFDASDIPFDEYEGVSHVIFILYIFFITIVLFNLMIALALSKVHDMEKNRILYRSFTEIDMIIHLEDYYLESQNRIHKIVQQSVYKFGKFFQVLYRCIFESRKKPLEIKKPVLRLKGNQFQQRIKFETYPKRRVRFFEKKESKTGAVLKFIKRHCDSFFDLDYNVVNKAWEIATKNRQNHGEKVECETCAKYHAFHMQATP